MEIEQFIEVLKGVYFQMCRKIEFCKNEPAHMLHVRLYYWENPINVTISYNTIRKNVPVKVLDKFNNAVCKEYRYALQQRTTAILERGLYEIL